LILTGICQKNKIKTCGFISAFCFPTYTKKKVFRSTTKIKISNESSYAIFEQTQLFANPAFYDKTQNGEMLAQR
jgi:hypothetical protein